MSDATATVSQKRGLNPIWIVPIVALALGIWMVIYTIQSQGPEITITFSTAEGLEAGKTKIKLRNVEIGTVSAVRLGDDRESVIVTASLHKEAESLLRDDTQFWVVRARIGKGGISGLGTLLSGGYIQLAPGTGKSGKVAYVGLEDPPVTPAGTPGVRVTLTARRAASVGPGVPVLYKGFTVGRVESETFDIEAKQLEYSAFIDAPYNELLTTNHRFWDTSGISVRVGADGIEADSVSVETLLIGGVEVGLPEGVPLSGPVDPGQDFTLYESFAAVNERPYNHHLKYVVRFDQSVRGLAPGAPVEYRGLRMGEVERVMVSELVGAGRGEGRGIPVLIRIEPARLELPDSGKGLEEMKEILTFATANGMRASLSTGNLLTGSLFVSLDMYPKEPKAEMGSYAGYTTLPTIASGLEGIAQKLTFFLDKLNELPLEGTVQEAQNTLASIDRLVAGEGMQTLPGSVDQTLAKLQLTLDSLSADSELQARLLPTITQLERTLASLRQMIDTLEQQPNALIFNRSYGDDPRPPAGSE